MGDIGIILGSDKMNVHETSLDTVPPPSMMGFSRRYIPVLAGPQIDLYMDEGAWGWLFLGPGAT